MNRPTLWYVLGLVAIAANVWAIVKMGRARRSARQFRAQAFDHFRVSRVACEDPRFAFLGSEARVIRTDEFGPVQGIFSKRLDYSVTFYAVNAFGECFVFKASPSGQTVKHLQPDLARAILKEQYVPVPSVRP